jgi:hypothetical protein
MVSELMLKLLVISMLTILVAQLPIVKASPLTVLSVDPRYIDDPTLVPGSTFDINITVADVQNLLGFEIVLSYYTDILSATDLEFYPPFQHIVVSHINDTEGYVSLLAITYLGDLEGFTTIDPAPIARIGFIVDSLGTSILHFDVSKLSDPYGNPISHMALDGYFGNQTPPVPEFPLGLTVEIFFIPLLIYIFWRSKQRKKPFQ